MISINYPPVSAPIPAYIRTSKLLKQGGFAVYEGLIDSAYQQYLYHEALRHQTIATESLVLESDETETRGGSPARKFFTAPAGDYLNGLYHSQHFINFLTEAIGLSVRPTGISGTYTYYTRAGDHLMLHRDIVRCERGVTIIGTKSCAKHYPCQEWRDSDRKARV